MLVASQPAHRARHGVQPEGAWRQRTLHTLQRGRCAHQAIATIGLAPLSMVFFQQVSVVGFAANLVAIPLVTLVITPLALLGVLLPPLWSAGRLGRARADGGCWPVLAAGADWPSGRPLPRRGWAIAGRPAGRAGGGAAAALAAALCWRCRWCCRCCFRRWSHAARGAGVRGRGGRHRPGHRGAGAHRAPPAGLRHRARPGRPRPMPASVCCCRCCARAAKRRSTC